MSSFYEREVLGRVLDVAMSGLSPLRKRLLAGVGGRVIELGFGTGANLQAYGPEVEELWGVDPSGALLDRAKPRADRSGLSVHLLEASASRPLPLESGTFDAVVITFVLCSVKNRAGLLHEARRLLRPGANLVLAEHVVSDVAFTRGVQHALRPMWSTLLGGCDPGFDALTALREAGFETTSLEQVTLALPYPVASGLVGRAKVNE